MRSPRPIAPRVRKLLFMEDKRDLYTFASLAFDAAAFAWSKGFCVPDYRPGAGGPCFSEMDPMRKDSLRRLSGPSLVRVSNLAWKVYKLKEERAAK